MYSFYAHRKHNLYCIMTWHTGAMSGAQQYRDLMTISQDTKCIYMMLSQCPISCASEIFQVLSPVLFQQSLYFSHRTFYLLVSALFFTCLAVHYAWGGTCDKYYQSCTCTYSMKTSTSATLLPCYCSLLH